MSRRLYVGPHMRHLSKRVNAGIGTAGALQIHAHSQGLFGGAAQFTHYRAGILLLLPAAVARPVVLDGQLPGEHMPSLAEPDRPLTVALRRTREQPVEAGQ